MNSYLDHLTKLRLQRVADAQQSLADHLKRVFPVGTPVLVRLTAAGRWIPCKVTNVYEDEFAGEIGVIATSGTWKKRRCVSVNSENFKPQ